MFGYVEQKLLGRLQFGSVKFLFSFMVSALPPQVSVAVFGTKMVTHSHLSLELKNQIIFLVLNHHHHPKI
jgi:hypothetical protein